VRASEPEKFKKINYDKKKNGAGKDGAQMNRRQKQKVSDLIKKLRVRIRIKLISIYDRSTTTSY